MDDLHVRIIEAAPLYLAWGGFLIGMAFGALVQLTNFCAMGSIADIASFGDYRRFRAWLLAATVALIGTQFLQHFAIVDVGQSMYLGTRINWLGNLLGGFLFGVGMVFAGGCASRNLVRLGAGDLRAAMVLLVMGSFAYMTLGGILGPARALLERQTTIALREDTTQGLDALLAAASGMQGHALTWIVAAVVAGALLVFCFADSSFRRSRVHIVSGIGIGLCVVAGWALTGLAYDEFADAPLNPVSLTYVRPTGDALEYLERFTANMVPGFGVATVFGALVGALLAALLARRFRVSGFADSGDTVRNLGGAALMGIGGVTALGCTIGQAVTGVSTLALGSFVAFAAIVAGGFAGIKWLEHMLAV